MTLVAPHQDNHIEDSTMPGTTSVHTHFATALQKILGMSFVSAFDELKAYIQKLKRAAYIPLIAGALAMTPQESQAQCCGLDYSMPGVSLGIPSTRDDYHANRKNGWTKDGYTVGVHRAWQRGHYIGKIGLGTSKITKYEDKKNLYEAYFPSVSIGQGVSFTDAEARIVPYVLIQGGVIGSLMSGVRNGIEFDYRDANFFLGPEFGVGLNIAERVKLGVSANGKIIPNGKLDNIPGGSTKADVILSIEFSISAILN